MGAGVMVVFVAVSVAVWWQVWSKDPRSTMTCACGDPSLFLSSFAWVAHAVAHGDNPFLSTAMYHPGGINYLANTSALLEAFVLLPVTWLFGPVASLNVTNTLAPALAAMATYWAVRRSLHVGRLGALVAGLMIELSPWVVGNGAVSHLHLSFLAFVPIVGVCLHELLVVQRGRATRWGALLAAAAIGQFFAGTELLLILALFSALVVAVAAVGLFIAKVRGSTGVGTRARHAAIGLGVGVAVCGALLAYPAWYALAGPRHIAGRPFLALGPSTGIQPSTTLFAPPPPPGLFVRLAGYPGILGAPGNYLGLGAVIVAFAALIVLRRRAAVWSLAAVGLVGAWLSLGATWLPVGSARPAWVPFLPWRTLSRLPILGSALAQNFFLLTLFAVTALVGLFVDRTARTGHARVRPIAVAVAVGVSAVVLVPLVTTWPLPLTAAPVQTPRWFVRDAPRLPAGSVVLAYPFADGEAVVWQAVGGMHVALVGGFGLVPGPDGHYEPGGRPGSAEALLGALSLPLGGPLPPLDDAAARTAVRNALARWKVMTVVVTDRGRDPVYATRWFTAVLGRPPVEQDGSHVWTLTPSAQRAAEPAR